MYDEVLVKYSCEYTDKYLLTTVNMQSPYTDILCRFIVRNNLFVKI